MTEQEIIQHKAEEILRKYVNGEYSQDICDLIGEWFVSEVEDEEKTLALETIFDLIVAYEKSPDQWSYQMLEEWLKRPGVRDRMHGNGLLIEKPKPKPRFFRSKPLIRVAASIAAAVVVIGGTFLIVNNTDNLGTVQVAAVQGTTDSLGTQTGTIQPERRIEVIEGVQKEVTLADGTHVWINSGSTLTYPEVFADGERRVTLKGEAFFEVEHDANHPFTVHTGHLDVRVLGTKFDVKAYPGADFTEIALFEGSVEVTAGSHSEKLTPGNRMTYRHESGAMEVERFTAQTAQDWRSATIFADDKSMPEILRMVGNYYDLAVECDPAAFPAGERYSMGFYKSDSAKKVLDLLVEISGGSFSYERRNDTIKIYGRK